MQRQVNSQGNDRLQLNVRLSDDFTQQATEKLGFFVCWLQYEDRFYLCGREVKEILLPKAATVSPALITGVLEW